MRQVTKTTGTNSSNAFFILTRRYQCDPKRGDCCHRGTHNKLLTDNALQITTQTMTKIMRTAAMQAAIMVTEMERGEDNTNTLPRRGEPPPRMTNNDHSSICPPLPNPLQSSGSTKKISAYKLDAACFNHLRFSVSDSERLKLKLKSTIGNSPADIILIRMILQSLVSPHLKLLLSSSS